jgi:hypothetical protein
MVHLPSPPYITALKNINNTFLAEIIAGKVSFQPNRTPNRRVFSTLKAFLSRFIDPTKI